MSNQKARNTPMGAKKPEHTLAYALAYTLRNHKQALLRSFKTLLNHPFSTSLTIIALGIILTLPLGGYVVANHFHTIYASLDKGTELTAYLKVDLSEASAKALIHHLEASQEIESVHYQSAEESLEAFKQSTDLGDVIELLPDNPLPAVLFIKPKEIYSSAQSLKSLQASLRKDERIDQIQLDIDWVEKLDAFYKVVIKGVWILSLLIGLGVVIILTNTIRLSLEKHRNEIVILSLIGATSSFIRRPFVYRALLYGFFGALLAILLVFIALKTLQQPLSELAILYSEILRLETIPAYAMMVLIFFCLILSWLSARLALIQYGESANLP